MPAQSFYSTTSTDDTVEMSNLDSSERMDEDEDARSISSEEALQRDMEDFYATDPPCQRAPIVLAPIIPASVVVVVPNKQEEVRKPNLSSEEAAEILAKISLPHMPSGRAGASVSTVPSNSGFTIPSSSGFTFNFSLPSTPQQPLPPASNPDSSSAFAFQIPDQLAPGPTAKEKGNGTDVEMRNLDSSERMEEDEDKESISSEEALRRDMDDFYATDPPCQRATIVPASVPASVVVPKQEKVQKPNLSSEEAAKILAMISLPYMSSGRLNNVPLPPTHQQQPLPPASQKPNLSSEEAAKILAVISLPHMPSERAGASVSTVPSKSDFTFNAPLPPTPLQCLPPASNPDSCSVFAFQLPDQLASGPTAKEKAKGTDVEMRNLDSSERMEENEDTKSISSRDAMSREIVESNFTDPPCKRAPIVPASVVVVPEQEEVRKPNLSLEDDAKILAKISLPHMPSGRAGASVSTVPSNSGFTIPSSSGFTFNVSLPSTPQQPLPPASNPDSSSAFAFQIPDQLAPGPTAKEKGKGKKAPIDMPADEQPFTVKKDEVLEVLKNLKGMVMEAETHANLGSNLAAEMARWEDEKVRREPSDAITEIANLKEKIRTMEQDSSISFRNGVEEGKRTANAEDEIRRKSTEEQLAGREQRLCDREAKFDEQQIILLDQTSVLSAQVAANAQTIATQAKNIEELNREGAAYVKELLGQLGEKDKEIERLQAEVVSCAGSLEERITIKEQHRAWPANQLAFKLLAPGETMLAKALERKRRGKESTPTLAEYQARQSYQPSAVHGAVRLHDWQARLKQQCTRKLKKQVARMHRCLRSENEACEARKDQELARATEKAEEEKKQLQEIISGLEKDLGASNANLEREKNTSREAKERIGSLHNRKMEPGREERRSVRTKKGLEAILSQRIEDDNHWTTVKLKASLAAVERTREELRREVQMAQAREAWEEDRRAATSPPETKTGEREMGAPLEVTKQGNEALLQPQFPRWTDFVFWLLLGFLFVLVAAFWAASGANRLRGEEVTGVSQHAGEANEFWWASLEELSGVMMFVS